jgi:hypothetical protein
VGVANAVVIDDVGHLHAAVELTLLREPMPDEGESDEAVAARLQARLRAVSGDLA